MGRLGLLNRLANAVAAYNPAAQFAPALPGLWVDASDYATLTQDSIATTAVTGVGQTVGLMLDKRLGGRGPELVSNGTFDSNLTGWILSQTATAGIPTWNAGVMQTNSDGSGFSRADLEITTVAGKKYYISGLSNGNNNIYVGTVQGGQTLFVQGLLGLFGGFFVASGTTTWIRIEDGLPTASSVDNISVKLLEGNHISQATAPARPLTGTSGAIQYLTFDGLDDNGMTGAATFSANMDCFIALRRNSSVLSVLCAGSVPASAYMFAHETAGAGTISAGVGASTTYAVNGVDVPGGTAATRAQLATAWPVSQFVVLEARNLDLTSANWGAIGLSNFGAGNFIGMDFVQMILAPAGDATARQKNRQYAGNKAGLTL